jgi:hypothetical protein
MKKQAIVGILTGIILVQTASAEIISLNFAENASNQAFTGGEMIGPLATDSTYWNSTLDRSSGSLATGTMNDLINDAGVVTTADASWSSANVWYNADGTGADQVNLAVGYLDDGQGITVNITSIPFAQYRVYGLISSDAGNVATGFDSCNPLVNGIYIYGGDENHTRKAFGTVNITTQETGQPWFESTDDATLGNYWTLETSGDLSITIQKIGGRASLSGVVIESIPEPASLAMIAFATGGLLFFRKKNRH